MLINITGSSGVGKTTTATILSHILSETGVKVLNICGDDLHKWPRNDKNWANITHLNPSANNLLQGKTQLFELLEGKSVYRDHYSHDTGKFVKNVHIEPADIIINEGLHSLYDTDICNAGKLNIFVETDDDLKYRWKLNRDIDDRGYTEDQVKLSLERRKIDENSYITPQKENANVIVIFRETKDGDVEMNYASSNQYGVELMSNACKFYETRGHMLINGKV